MTFNPYKRKVALWYAFLLWIFGFVWGTIVFMVPVLKGIASILGFQDFLGSKRT